MLSCDEVHNLLEDYVSGALSEEGRRAVVTHLEQCVPCREALEDARLARLVLRETATPPPPRDLAAHIKSAAVTHLRHRPRPMHQRALGSPAFLATCASLLCGAVICMMAILKVEAVHPPASTDRPAVLVANASGRPHLVLETARTQPSASTAVASQPVPPLPGRPPLAASRQVAEAPPGKQAAASVPLMHFRAGTTAAGEPVIGPGLTDFCAPAKPTLEMFSQTAAPSLIVPLATQRISYPGAVTLRTPSLFEALPPPGSTDQAEAKSGTGDPTTSQLPNRSDLVRQIP